jgi:hypothetical protein
MKRRLPEMGLCEEGPGGSKLLCVPILVGIAILAYLLFRQGVQGVPVPTRPLEGEGHAGPAVRFCWNPAGHEDVELQVARKRGFGNILFERRVQGAWFSVSPPVFVESGKYYWRMRKIRAKGPGTWSRAIPFTID